MRCRGGVAWESEELGTQEEGGSMVGGRAQGEEALGQLRCALQEAGFCNDWVAEYEWQ